MSFHGKSALVIGLGGIGIEIIQHLAANGVQKFGIISRSTESSYAVLQDLRKHLIIAFRQASVEDEAALRVAMYDIRDTFGALDFIINTAAILDDRKPSQTIAINYGGIVSSTLIGMELLRKDKGGHGGIILNFASIASFGSHFWAPIYCGTKHAVLAFTRSIVYDKFFNISGISFITVCPGVTLTSLLTAGGLYVSHITSEDFMDDVKDMVARLGIQKADIVGQCTVEALKDGENGAVWLVENGKIEKLSSEKLKSYSHL